MDLRSANRATVVLPAIFGRLNRQAVDLLAQQATGLRVGPAANDPAGLIAAEHLRAELAAIEAEGRSLARADAVAATADGALSEMSGLLAEAEGLAVANASDGFTDAEKQANQAQIDSILSTVDRLASTTTFNGQRVFDGSVTLRVAGASLTLEGVSTGQLGSIDVGGTSRAAIDVRSGGALNTVGGDVAGAAAVLRSAAGAVATMRGEIGAFRANAIDASRAGLEVTGERLAEATARIRDADQAAVATGLVRLEVLGQAATLAGRAMLGLGGSPGAGAHRVTTLLGA